MRQAVRTGIAGAPRISIRNVVQRLDVGDGLIFVVGMDDLLGHRRKFHRLARRCESPTSRWSASPAHSGNTRRRRIFVQAVVLHVTHDADDLIWRLRVPHCTNKPLPDGIHVGKLLARERLTDNGYLVNLAHRVQ